ncbi:GGDEF domain-containing protein [Actinokineospora iranica]|uniref:PAS domain S-box-containing protein/diguanylate cyclase (GGDEF) domain-containing protein n=1 Tax=Actinokineospora iranica TaxID=1271860 RepID=A0A1G6W4Y2_9PSEU|nr:diguanylate cyclase [Actinokineospora iranica]SDD60899.1 PAS domain S-box-containing protein/diguanylate cyclase (GGDEF) domain-containing protein [Actinokineospora iranica]
MQPLEPSGDRQSLVRGWLRVVAATAYVPASAADVESLLSGLLAELTAAVAADPVDTARAARVGERMVTGALTGEATLAGSLRVLGRGLLDGGHDPVAVVSALGAVATGYAGALRIRTLDQQENMKVALLTAKQRAERDRRHTETRFREVFTASSIGIAITELDGRFVEVNPALAAILGCPVDELANRSLAEFIVPDDDPNLPGDRKLLIRPGGDTAWVYLTTSLLRGDDGQPVYRVAMVQDLSELQLLGSRLSHQNLHDALTGLANRLHFESRLEAVHGQAPPGSVLTLLCLDLDAFSLVNTTHGHLAGDRLLRTVAHRLATAVAGHDALVARVDGDEFAVLIVHGRTAPPVAEVVELVTGELSEPDYDGHLGLAATASVGVARAHAADTSSAELFRAADAALRHSRETGKHQWTEFDSRADHRARKIGRGATALPAAWENGELTVAYRPVVRLSDNAPVRVRALVHKPGSESASDLAEMTGLSVALGPWLINQSTENLPTWQSLFTPDTPVQRVLLSPLQSADADLSATVNRAIATAQVPPGLLEIALDTPAVLAGRGDARDNLRTLADIGVAAALHEFTGGPRQLAVAERFEVRAVILADLFDGWRPDWLPADTAPVRATRELVAALTGMGASVGVLGVRDHTEARWWADLGVQTAEGPAFGDPTDPDGILSRVRSAATTTS